MTYKLFNVTLILLTFNSCINNYKQEELKIYSELAKETFIYDSSRSEINNLVNDNFEDLRLKLNPDSTFYFISSNPKLSDIRGRWRISDFPEMQFWIFKVDGELSEQWNRTLEIKIKLDSSEATIAFIKENTIMINDTI